MPSERNNDNMKRWRWRPRFSIRELLALTCIVALSLGFLRELAIRREMTRRLEAALNSPIVRLANSRSMNRYSVTSNIAIVGELLLPLSLDELAQPRVRYQLLRASDFSPIAEMPAMVVLIGAGHYSFGETFTQPLGQPSGLEPGIYIVRVECFDGEELIATELLSLEAVEKKNVADE